MGSIADYAENALMNHIFGTAYTAVATVYLALFTADPTDTGSLAAEVANSNNYARAAITFAAASARRVTQTGAVTFNQASGAWGTITHWAIIDTNTLASGNVLATGQFSSSFAPVNGSTPSIATGQVYVEITAVANHDFTTQLANWLLDKMFRNQTYAQPATYVALLTSVGADADTTLSAKEVTGNNYARVLVNKTGGSSPQWGTVAAGAVTNANAANFATVGAGGWTQIVGACLVDTSSANTGNVLMYDNDNVVDQTPAANDTVQFANNSFNCSLA